MTRIFLLVLYFVFFSSRRRHTRFDCDWSSDVCSSDLGAWPDVARDLPRGGTLLEYGCGIAPVTAWLERRRRDFRAVLLDVPGHALDFAVWRRPRSEEHPPQLQSQSNHLF